ncbi:hypothetical protein PVAG01_00250 [Phlyctema vagabunda]|uniref:Uncharacterized protein n=1 Tax=Phlyctema vagabunda TaxID=108571 RepID=A0ABR4PU31_9HELO
MPSFDLQTPPQAAAKNLILTYLPHVSPATAIKLDEDIERLAESWKLPYSIEDEDLTFDGKALSTLYEEETSELRIPKPGKIIKTSHAARGRPRYRQTRWRQTC